MENNLKKKKFLEEQILLPPEKRSEEFKRYVEEKFKRPDPEDLASFPEEKAFVRYLHMLDLSEGDLPNKKILDLGCGEEAEFLRYCIDKGINKEVYGLDIKVGKISERYKGHVLKGNYNKKLPVRGFDLIVSVGAIFLFSKFKKPLKNAIEALAPGGQVRIAPLWQDWQGSENIGIVKSRKNLENFLMKLEKKKDIKWEAVPVEIRTSGNYQPGDTDNVWLDEVLIIRKVKQ